MDGIETNVPPPAAARHPDPSREPQRLDSRQNRDLIVQTAIRVLGSDANASMAVIADQAGVSRSTIYRRFPSRLALIDELTTVVAAEFSQAIESSIDAGGVRYADVLAAVLHQSTLLADRFRFLELNAVPMDDTAAGGGWLGLLAEGQRAGEFRADFPVAWLSSIARALNLEAIQMVHRGVFTIEQASTFTIQAVLAAVAVPGDASTGGPSAASA